MNASDDHEPPRDAARSSSEVHEQAFAAVMGGLVGLAVGGPIGGVVGAAAVPHLKEIAQRSLAELRSDNEQRAIAVLGVAQEETELSDAELLAWILARPRSRLLAGTAIEAAMRTVNEAKIRALGRALASGLLAEDDAAIDDEQLIIGALADMETSHVAVLDLLVNHWPYATIGNFEVQQYDPAEFPNVGAPERESFSPGRRRWTENHLVRARPAVRPVLAGILGTLQRHGLAAMADTLPNALEKFAKKQSEEAARSIRAGGSGGTVSATSISHLMPPATWVPTELGARVLDYLAEAPSEHSHDE